MAPKTPTPQSGQLFGYPLADHLNMKHPLEQLAGWINRDEITQTFADHFVAERGRAALAPQLVAGLLYLQHTFDCSDEIVVNTWVENPYWQYFIGETYFQTEATIDPSSLTRWKKRIGEEGVETLHMVSIEAARRGGSLEGNSNTSV